MIRRIVIQNIAIADNLSVDFGSGLNIVTGETGAGKSILVDALALLRGGRVETGLIRTGFDSAQVSGVFELRGDSPVWLLLTEHGIEADLDSPDEVVLRRVIQRNGRHRAYVNDVPVNARTLQIIAEELIDISSQFENQKLLDVHSHTSYLDAFCGAVDVAAEVAALYDSAYGLLDKVFRAEAEREKKMREKDLYEFEFNEISAASPNSSEFLEVESLLQIARKTGVVTTLCQETMDLLVDSDTSCFSTLQFARKNIEKLERLTENSARPISAKILAEAFAVVDAVVDEVRVVARSFSVDEERLAWANERIEVYNKLLRKFGPDVDAILRHRDECESFLRDASNMDSEIDSLAQAAVDAIQKLVDLAGKLSRSRRSSPEVLAQKVQRELAELGMAKARFVCQFQECALKQESIIPARIRELLGADLMSAFLRQSRFGSEEARFLLSANAGIDPQSIEKVASGGELSRVMLAIKTILFADQSVNLFVFDEIDTGISGNVAAKVGRKLAQFCENRQAICITHLPQVACHARSHFVARKSSKAGKTVASLTLLKDAERAQELAGMLSGEKVTQEGLAQARALLKEARV